MLSLKMYIVGDGWGVGYPYPLGAWGGGPRLTYGPKAARPGALLEMGWKPSGGEIPMRIEEINMNC